jgi:hypothetical protein
MAAETSHAARKNIGYCTNVHAGATLDQTRENLRTHAVLVRNAMGIDGPLSIGLWLSAGAVREIVSTDGATAFADWLGEAGLDVFTINGFPYGDFHKPVVKHDVYRPDWSTPRRLEFTLDLARILAAIRPGGEGGISTLPLGWGPWMTDDGVAAAAANLRKAALALADLEQATGVLVHLDLEPEPGCSLQRATDVVSLFERHLLTGTDDDLIRRHLRVCHDICHAAVMFEDQAAMLGAYDSVGVQVGKVQVSSAVRAQFDDADGDVVRAALGRFREERYLHQTMVRTEQTAEPVFYEDLPDALASATPAGEWRVHFHIPIFLDRLGPLRTTADEIDKWLMLVRDRPEICHFEVETYAWEVMPAEHKRTLAEDIAAELRWLHGRFGTGTDSEPCS